MVLKKPEVPKIEPAVAILFLSWSIHLSRYDPAPLTTFASLPEVMDNPKNPNFDFRLSHTCALKQNIVPLITSLFLNRFLPFLFSNVICIIVYNLSISGFDRVFIDFPVGGAKNVDMKI
jgi:hypothetical protein